MAFRKKHPVEFAEIQKSFQFFESLLMDKVSIEPAYVSNIAEMTDEGDSVRIDFDTKKARFGHMGDGNDTVEAMHVALSKVGIVSEKVPDPYYKEGSFTSVNNQPSLVIVLKKDTETLKKLSDAKVYYISSVLEETVSSLYKGIAKDEKYGFNTKELNKINRNFAHVAENLKP